MRVRRLNLVKNESETVIIEIGTFVENRNTRNEIREKIGLRTLGKI